MAHLALNFIRDIFGILVTDQLDKTALLDQKKERTLPAIIRWYEPCKSVSVICSNDNWQVKHKMELDKVDRKSHTKNDK